jgi:mannosyltransferase OCH1-like enzyme
MEEAPTTLVPRVIHQIWLRGSPQPMPRFLDGWRRSAIATDCSYLLHIEEEGWGELDDAIHQSVALTRKADIIRLAALYRFGGVYIDADIKLVRPLSEDFFEREWLVYENEDESMLIANHAMGFSAGSPLLREALNLILAGREGCVTAATGPALITELAQKYPMKILPARTFAPLHYSGRPAPGNAPVYGRHVWATTRDAYDGLEEPPAPPNDRRVELAHTLRLQALRKVSSTRRPM